MQTLIARSGLWFEQSGASMAVYNHRPRPWDGNAPECPFTSLNFAQTASPYISRMDLRDSSHEAFLEGIDEWFHLRSLSGEAA